MKQSAHNEQFLRENSREFYYWSLFVPVDHRGAAQALLCFDIELTRIPQLVSDPSLGEIRLQWWRDAINSGLDGVSSGHPVADVLCHAINRYSLPRNALIDMIDARTFDLYDDRMPEMTSLEGYLGETYGCLIRLLTIILADGRDTGPPRLCGNAGIAIGIRKIFEAPYSAMSKAERFVPTEMDGRVDHKNGDCRSRIIDETALKHLNVVVGSWTEIPDYARLAFLPLSISKSVIGPMKRKTDIDLPSYKISRRSEFSQNSG